MLADVFETDERFSVYEPHRYAFADWLDLLAAATILKCSNLRRRAISELESPAFSASMDAADKIFIARKYDINAWLIPTYVSICLKESPVCEREINLLGSRLASQLCGIRERLLFEAMENLSIRPQGSTREGQRSLKKSIRRARQLVEEIVGEVSV